VNDPTHYHTSDTGDSFVLAGHGSENAGPAGIYASGNTTAAAYTGISLNASNTGISIQNAGSGAGANVAPTAMTNKIIKS
jgi:hypothetical protein